MVLRRVEIKHRVIGNVLRRTIFALIIDKTTQRGRVTNHTHVQRSRRCLDNHFATSGRTIAQALADARGHNVAQLNLAAGVLKDATFDDEALIREMNLM
jgi:hypothetical protein